MGKIWAERRKHVLAAGAVTIGLTMAMFSSSAVASTRKPRTTTTSTTSTTVKATTTTVASTTTTSTTAATATTTTIVSSSGVQPAAAGGRALVVAPGISLSSTMASLRPGDALYLHGGDYNERINFNAYQATSSSPILVTNYPGETPVIHGLLWIDSPTYWTVKGLSVTWNASLGGSSDHMVKIKGGSNWTFTENELWDAHSYAALLVAESGTSGSPKSWIVSSNIIHDTADMYAGGTGPHTANQDHLIYVNAGVSSGPGWIINNLLYNATNGEAIKLGGSTSTASTEGAAGVVVQFNTIYNTAQSILVSWYSHDNTIEKNVMVKTQSTYGAIRGYQLTGTNNVASNNFAYATKSVILNYDAGVGITDGGGNAMADPMFDSAATASVVQPYSGGLHVTNPAMAGFGQSAH